MPITLTALQEDALYDVLRFAAGEGELRPGDRTVIVLERLYKELKRRRALPPGDLEMNWRRGNEAKSARRRRVRDRAAA